MDKLIDIKIVAMSLSVSAIFINLGIILKSTKFKKISRDRLGSIILNVGLTLLTVLFIYVMVSIVMLLKNDTLVEIYLRK